MGRVGLYEYGIIAVTVIRIRHLETLTFVQVVVERALKVGVLRVHRHGVTVHTFVVADET